MATTTRKSEILDEMHETARGLHSVGVISKRRMGEFDALCHRDVHQMPPQEIKLLREQSQPGGVFRGVEYQSVYGADMGSGLQEAERSVPEAAQSDRAQGARGGSVRKSKGKLSIGMHLVDNDDSSST